MPRKRGPPPPGSGPGPGSTAVNEHRSPNAATLPGYLDPEGAHGEIWVALMRPAAEGEKLPSNPFTLAKTINASVGTIHSAHRNKDGNLVIKVRGEAKLKKLLRLDQLIGNPTKVVVEEHPTMNRTKVVVTCRSVEGMTEEELKNEPSLKEQGVVDIRRFKKAGQPTNTMTVTVRGTCAPAAIFFGFERCEAKEFVPAPMQCYRCYEYGHTKLHCKAEAEVCRNCSQTHEIVKEEGKTVCPHPARCLHCNGGHSPSTRVCEKYREEEEILRIRNSTGKSPREARQYFNELKQQKVNSYARVAGGNKSVQDRITAAQSDCDIAALRKELDEAKKAIAEAAALRKELAESKKALKAALRSVEILKKANAAMETESSDDMEDVTVAALPVNKHATETIDKAPTEQDSQDEDMEISKPTNSKNKRRISDSSSSLAENAEEEPTKKTNPQLNRPDHKKPRATKEEGRKNKQRNNNNRRDTQ